MFHRSMCQIARTDSETYHVLEERNKNRLRTVLVQATDYFRQTEVMSVESVKGIEEYTIWRGAVVQNALLLIELVEYITTEIERATTVVAGADGDGEEGGEEYETYILEGICLGL